MSEPRRPSISERYWRLPWLFRIGVVVVGGVAVLAALGVIGQGAGSSRDTAPSRPAASVPAATPAGQIGSGVWLVGVDVTPGTYRSTGSVDGRYCLWSRHDTAAGGPSDGVITSDGSFDGQMLVTIEATDVVFRTNDCAPFVRVG